MSENRLRAIEASTILQLISLLETGDARLKKEAATALDAFCSSVRENRLRAIEASVVRPLLDLSFSLSRRGRRSPSSCHHVPIILCTPKAQNQGNGEEEERNGNAAPTWWPEPAFVP
jgi:hypothetical protein